jgi:hypothetical protein
VPYVDFVLLPWPSEAREFAGAASVAEVEGFRGVWRRVVDAMGAKGAQKGIIRNLGE